MSAETLRRAAALMRERAEAATPAPSWHPAFALAVADWLDCIAVDGDNGYEESDDNYHAAMDVCRAYLGESALTCPASGPGWCWGGTAFVDVRLWCVLSVGHPGPHFGKPADGSLQPFDSDGAPDGNGRKTA